MVYVSQCLPKTGELQNVIHFTNMKGLRIQDCSESGYLSFDLADILALVPDAAKSAHWIVSDIDATMKEGCSLPDDNETLTWSWTTLLEFSASVMQTIDGKFQSKASSHPNRIIIEAIDSSYWEVCTDHEEFLTALKEQFAEVRDLSVDEVRLISG